MSKENEDSIESSSNKLDNADRPLYNRYYDRTIKWIPNNVNPDLVLVVSAIGIFFNTIILFTILLKFDQIAIVFSTELFIKWVGDYFLELLGVLSLLISLFFSMIFSNIALQRILEENTKLKVPFEEFFNFVNEPRVSKFAFQFFMIATGAVLLRVLADRGFPLQDTLIFMLAWLLLMLLIPTPKAAKMDVDPFGEEEINYIDGSQQFTKVKNKVMGSEDLQQCPKCEKYQPLQSIQCEHCDAELV